MVTHTADASSSTRLARAVLSRWVVPNEGLFWAVVVVAFALDLATTRIGLAVGLAERNPVAASLLAAHGFAALVWLKVAVLGVGAACCTALPAGARAAVPVGLAIPSCGAVVVNVAAIALAI